MYLTRNIIVFVIYSVTKFFCYFSFANTLYICRVSINYGYASLRLISSEELLSAGVGKSTALLS